MNNKQLVEYKPSLISKIRNFFKKLFCKSSIENEKEQEISANNINNISKEEEFLKDIKVDVKDYNKLNEKKEFLKNINGNKKALNMLSVDRLKKLSKYYSNEIQKNNDKINQNNITLKKLKVS